MILCTVLGRKMEYAGGGNLKQQFYAIYEYGKKKNISVLSSHERGRNGTEVRKGSF